MFYIPTFARNRQENYPVKLPNDWRILRLEIFFRIFNTLLHRKMPYKCILQRKIMSYWLAEFSTPLKK